MGKRIFLAMRRFVERLARVQPLVLVFEDLHWMDASSVELLEHILPVVREAPLLLISLSRPNSAAAASFQGVCSEKYPDLYTEIHLAPLSQPQTIELLKNLLAVDHLPLQLRDTVTRKAEGNPFFIEEIIRSLLDTGAIVRDPSGGRWRLTAQLDALHIPDTVQGVIMARIDRLDEQVKQTLCMAAVIGRSFLYRILYEIEQASSALDQHLAQLEQLELSARKQLQPGWNIYSFMPSGGGCLKAS
jgi:predicted ATPase